MEFINLMVDTDYWKYATLYFLERNIPKFSEPEIRANTIPGKICSKLFGVNEWKCKSVNGCEEPGDIYAIVELPKSTNGWTLRYGYIKKARQGMPIFAYPRLEGDMTYKSYIATDEPFNAIHSGCVELDTLENAKKLKLFIETNKLVPFYRKRMNLRAIAGNFLFDVKRFSLAQIKTGNEYPTEFGLTEEEIGYLETLPDAKTGEVRMEISRSKC